MATAPEEMNDLGAVAGALLVNFGTIQNLDGMLAAGMFCALCTDISSLSVSRAKLQHTPQACGL